LCERVYGLVVTGALVAPQVLGPTPRGSEFNYILKNTSHRSHF